MSIRQTSLFGVSELPFRLVFLIWLVYTVQFYTHWDLFVLGVRGQSLPGLVGILTAPLIHSNIIHVFSNTFPLLFLGTVLFFFFEGVGRPVFFQCYFLPNVLVWLISTRDTYHIGASGMVYALASFIIVFGLLKREFWSVLVAIVVTVSYGSIFVYGLFPDNTNISWEAHVGGAVTGIGSAIYYRWFKR